MQRFGLALSLILSLSTFACSDDSAGGGDGGGATGGSSSGGTSSGGTSSGGTSSGGTSSGGTSSGGTSSGGSGGSGVTGGSAGVATGGSATGGAGGSGGTEMKRGICDQMAEAIVTADDYEGTEEFFILSQEAVEDGRIDDPMDADKICSITFDVTRSGTAPAGCEDSEGGMCPWTHTVTYSNPQVLIGADGGCANSELGWDEAWVDEKDGSTDTYGYIYMFAGHDSVVLTYDEMRMAWIEIGRAYWSEKTGEFNFRVRIGACRY
jgi:hypothetical protein